MTIVPYAIYNGRGTHTTPFSGPFLSLEELLSDSWRERFQILIMPGGRDSPYHEDLQGKGNAFIRTFVEQGGTYVGICAGAYYGCARVVFDEGQPLEVCEMRELSFFSGSAVGPAYGKGSFAYRSEKGSRAALIETAQGERLHVYYNGGCSFEGDLSEVTVLASYLDLPGKPPAIIACNVGQGRAILSGVHIEKSAAQLDAKNPYSKPLIPLLEADEDKRARLWCTLLSHRP